MVGPPTQNFYCASHIFITGWLATLGTMSTMRQFHLLLLQVTKCNDQQREHDDERNVTARRKTFSTVRSSVVMMRLSSVFVGHL